MLFYTFLVLRASSLLEGAGAELVPVQDRKGERDHCRHYPEPRNRSEVIHLVNLTCRIQHLNRIVLNEISACYVLQSRSHIT